MCPSRYMVVILKFADRDMRSPGTVREPVLSPKAIKRDSTLVGAIHHARWKK